MASFKLVFIQKCITILFEKVFNLKLQTTFAVMIVSLQFGISGCQTDSDVKIKTPNIVFIVADDLGVHQLGCYGSTYYETPNIDGLAENGIKFTNAYAAATVCSPTRASILTGKYPARLHLTDYIPGKTKLGEKLKVPEWRKYLSEDEVTIAEVLKRAGYVTGHFGKWHLNIDKKYERGRSGDPGSQGFDDVLTTHKPGAGPESKYENDKHHVKEITQRALDFIEKNQKNKFFCYIPHNTIHAPEIEDKLLVEKYENKKGSKKGGHNNPVQAAMLETLDNSVAKILAKLKELNLEENTILIFYSDNGQLGDKNGKPFRGSKGDLYEGGIRMPLIIYWPGTVVPGMLSEELVISNDFFPTFSELANVKIKSKNDGISLLPIIKNPEAKINRNTLYWHYPHYHGTGLGPQGAIREGKYKLVEWFENSIDNEKGAFELYDLLADPGEQNNLVDSLPQVSSRLLNKLKTWRSNVGAQEMVKN